MVKYTWHTSLVPLNINVRQVYGIAFSNDFRIFLRIEDGKYALTGGKPKGNETYEETLKREYIEEANIELSDCYYLGYLLVEDEDSTYAQVRMIAKIKKINKNTPDPITGKIYKRELVNPYRVKEYLNYQEAGNLMLLDAIELAKEKYQFNKIYYLLQLEQ